MKFVAVHRVGLMTRRKWFIDHPFPIMWLVLGENWAIPPPPQHREAKGSLFKLAFYRQILSTPKCCHMDLGLAGLVLTHHHLHRHQQLPSSPSHWERVSSSFLLAVKYFSSGLSFSLVWLSLELLSSSPLEYTTCDSSPLTQPFGPPVLPVRCYLIKVVVGRSL